MTNLTRKQRRFQAEELPGNEVERAVRATVETELSYRNDTIMIKIITFRFEANKNKDSNKVALASSNS